MPVATLHSWAAGNHSWPLQSAMYMPHSTSRSLCTQWDSWLTPLGASPAHPGPTLASGALLALLSAHGGTLGLSCCCLRTLSGVVSPQGIPSWEVLTTQRLTSGQASLTSASSQTFTCTSWHSQGPETSFHRRHQSDL